MSAPLLPGAAAYSMREAEIIRAEIQERLETMLEPYIERARTAQWEVSAGETIHQQVADKLNIDPEEIREALNLDHAARVSALIEAVMDLHHACVRENIEWVRVATPAIQWFYKQNESLTRYLVWRAPDDPKGRPPNTIHMVD